MAYTFDGSSQYIQVGAAGLNIGTTRPITVAVLFDSKDLRAGGNYEALIGTGSDGTQKGWLFRIRSDTNTLNFRYFVTGPTGVEYITSVALTANSGIYLAVAVLRSSGANSIVDIYLYSYRTGLWTVEHSGNLSNTALIAPGGSDVTTISSAAGDAEYFPGQIGWAGMWNADLSNGGMARPPAIAALIERGGWALLTPDCKLFLPLTIGLVDYASPGRVQTLISAPTAAPPMLTEQPPVPTWWAGILLTIDRLAPVTVLVPALPFYSEI